MLKSTNWQGFLFVKKGGLLESYPDFKMITQLDTYWFTLPATFPWSYNTSKYADGTNLESGIVYGAGQYY